MAPPTKPSRRRASKHAVYQLLNQLTGDDDRDTPSEQRPSERRPGKRRQHSNDPRWGQLMGMSKGKSRKEKRQEARRMKKAKTNAFHQKQSLGSVTLEDISVHSKEKELKEKEKQKMEERKKQKQLHKEKQRLRKQQDAEDMRKQHLLDDNEMEEKTIKKLEKELHFHKNKKTKKKMLPSIFKADGLDYLLDVVDPAKIDDLDDEDEMDAEEDEEDQLGLLDALGSDGEDDEDDEEEEEEDADEEEMDQLSRTSGLTLDNSDNDDDDEQERTLKRSKRTAKNADIDTEINRDVEDRSRKPTRRKGKQRDGESDEEEGEDFDDSHNASDDSARKNQRTMQKESEDENSYDSSTDARTSSEKPPPLKMDPYGNIIGEKPAVRTGAYVPPQKRAKMMGEDEQKKEQLERLKKQLKGLLNRLSDSNISSISGQVEELYLKHSRNDMNETLTELILQACVGPSLTPDRLIMEQMLLISVLHTNVGNEVGAHFIQTIAVKFDQLYKSELMQEDKQCDNIILLFTHLYNMKVIHCTLIYDLIRLLVDGFLEKDIEMLLLLLRNCGMMLRKDDPSSLKEIILQIQTKAGECPEEFKQQSRVKFMLDTIFAIRNNNLRKIPNYDPSHLDHLRKLLKALVRDRGHTDSEGTLRIAFKDLLLAEDKGRWWIVGSAWLGNQHGGSEDTMATGAAILNSEGSDKISELSRKQRMNTDIRRTIFGILMTAEDYMDAFEKCLRLGLKGGREREIVHVLLDCCMQEKQFNPYYAYLATKFCQFERKFRMAFQFALWDKFKILADFSEENTNNLAHLLVHLMSSKALPISILKVIEFADIDKSTVKFLRTLLLGILQHSNDTIKSVLDIVVGNTKLKMLSDGLRLFLHHFILKALNKKKGLDLSEKKKDLVREKAKFADDVLRGEDTGV